MSTDAIPYQGFGVQPFGGLQEENAILRHFKRFFIQGIFFTASFLLSGVSIAGGILPLGISFFMASFGLEINKWLLAISVLSGIFLTTDLPAVWTSGIAMAIFALLYQIFLGRDDKKQTVNIAMLGLISVLVPYTAITYIEGFLLFDILQTVFKSVVVFALVFVFRMALRAIEKPALGKTMENEEMVSISITILLAVAGFGEFQIYGFQVRHMISVMVTLVLSYSFGSGAGAAIGVASGLIHNLALGGIVPMSIATFGICGLLAGVLRSMGKFGTAVGFLGGYALLGLNFSGTGDTMFYLQETALATFFYTTIPKKALLKISSFVQRQVDIQGEKKIYSTRIKEVTIKKLEKFAQIFQELSRTFNEKTEHENCLDGKEMTGFFDQIADKVCKNCERCSECWDQNFYSTYRLVCKIIEELDTKGIITKEDVPDYFAEKCGNIQEFVQETNHTFEMYRMNVLWKGRVGESRGIVSKQLDGLSKVIAGLAREVGLDMRFKSDWEDMISAGLKQAGVGVREVVVVENRFSDIEVQIVHKGCGGRQICMERVSKVVSDIVGRKMIRDGPECLFRRDLGGCSLKLVEEQVYSVTTGVAKKSKHENDVSGDCYTFMPGGHGKYIAALCDGMGSGEVAARQSQATINLLEKLIESGFDKDTAIQMINSVLALKSGEETFSTIDLSVVDLFRGNVEFVKIGAPPTFIKKQGRIETIRAFSVPVGILENIEVELVTKKVEDGDFIILVSDGIYDSFKNSEQQEIQSFLQDLDSLNPQAIADKILTRALEFSGGRANDDMTVLCAKVWRKSSMS